MSTGQSSERESDLNRLLTFVDAVIAIAITLLILPLVDLTTDVGKDDSVANLLRSVKPELWSFFLSFTVIARLWFAQHRTVRHVMRSVPVLDRMLVLWTLTIVFLPFPTALVAKAGEQPATKILYIGTIAVSMALIALLDSIIARHPEITDGSASPRVAPAVVSSALFVLALAISLAIPSTGYYPLFLLLIEPGFTRAFDYLRGKRNPTQ